MADAVSSRRHHFQAIDKWTNEQKDISPSRKVPARPRTFLRRDPLTFLQEKHTPSRTSPFIFAYHFSLYLRGLVVDKIFEGVAAIAHVLSNTV